jgi:hypothetical protein
MPDLPAGTSLTPRPPTVARTASVTLSKTSVHTKPGKTVFPYAI